MESIYMQTHNYLKYRLMLICLLIASVLFAGTNYSMANSSGQGAAFSLPVLFQAVAPSAPVTSYECTQVGLDEIDPALLTKEERIALLEGKLSDSINSFSMCVSQAQSAMSGGGNGQGAEFGQLGAGEDATEPQNNLGSVESELDQISEEIASSNKADTGEVGNTPTTRGIIPPKNNDKIICKLLFQEITKTTDLGLLEGLKEQYANYKCG